MRKLSVFNTVSIDGYFVDAEGEMHWAHSGPQDAEFQEWVEGNASGDGVLLFGRVTYEMMASYWPSPMAAKNNPVVAKGMNARTKYVFSRTLEKANWQNTTVLRGILAEEVRKLKSKDGPGLVILGSGSIVAQLAEAKLIDSYQVVVAPIALGGGRTIFDGIPDQLRLKLVKSRAFTNGNVALTYEPLC